MRAIGHLGLDALRLRTSVLGVTWWGYVQAVSGRATQAEIASRIGVTPPSVGRWRTGGVDPRSAAAFARSYGHPVLEAFVAAGFLTEEEAEAEVIAVPDIGSLSDDELIAELRARLAERHPQEQPDGASTTTPTGLQLTGHQPQAPARATPGDGSSERTSDRTQAEHAE